MDDIDILCVGPGAMSGVCGSSLRGSGAFVFMISKVGAVSSPGLVVGEPVSGAGVCECGLPLEEAGEDCASCVSAGGGMMGLLCHCLFGGSSTTGSVFAGAAACPSRTVPTSVDSPTVCGSAPTEGASGRLGGFAASLASLWGRADAGRDGAMDRGESGRLTGCNEALRLDCGG